MGIPDGYIAHAARLIREQHFRRDGKAVLYLSYDGVLPKLTITLRETTLDGHTRVLRDLTSEVIDFGLGAIALTGDSILYHRGKASVIPLQGAPDMKWMARTAVNRKGIDLAAIDGSSKRTIPVSFACDQENPVRFHPNGREIVAPAAVSDGSPAGLMAVPLDGITPRRLVTFGRHEKLTSYSISSDGKTILYVVSGAQSTVLLDVGLSPGMPGTH